MVEKLILHFGTDKIAYFPSYELVMDELRDYRFYATDMLHLSELAITFIQEKFNTAFLDRESCEMLDALKKIVKTLSHKPFQQNSTAYQEVLIKLEEEVKSLTTSHTGVNLNDLIIEINQKKGS